MFLREIPANPGAITSLGLCRVLSISALSSTLLSSTLHAMNNNICLKLLISFLAVVALNGLPSVVEAHHKPWHLQGPPTVAVFAQIQPLTFGVTSPGAVGGTLTVSDSGTVSVTGSVTSLGGEFNALISVDTCAGSVTTFTLTNGVLTGPGTDITITNLTCIGPGGTSGSGGCFYSGTAGTDVLAVGGTISIPAGQVAGVYSGVFDIVGTHDPGC